MPVTPRPARADAALLIGLSALAALPALVNPHLPLFDYPAHLVVPAALRHRADPATQVAALFELQVGLFPNSLHYLWTWLLSYVMPLELASRLFLVFACLLPLPAALALALRAFGRDWRLAVLAVPLTWSRGFWYGFVGFCAALSLSLVLLALLQQDLEQPSRRRKVLLGLVCAILPFAHFFVMLVTVGLGLILAALHLRTRPWRPVLISAATLAPGPALMAAWFLGSLGSGGSASGSALAHLIASRPDAFSYARMLRHWFIDGYVGSVDDLVAVLMVATLAVLTIRGPGGTRSPLDGDGPRRGGPLWLAGALALGYLAFPFELRGPFHWWAMNVRLLPLLFLWLVVATPPGPLDRRGRLLLLPLTAAATLYLAYINVDLRVSFNGDQGMAGFDEVIDRVPPGAAVAGLYTDYRAPLHHQHYPYTYAACYAFVRRGGAFAPFEPIPQAWTNPRQIPDHPFAGDAALFRHDRHAAAFTHFLVRTCSGPGCVPDPLAGRADAKLVIERGRWRLYEKRPVGITRPSPP